MYFLFSYLYKLYNIISQSLIEKIYVLNNNYMISNYILHDRQGKRFFSKQLVYFKYLIWKEIKPSIHLGLISFLFIYNYFQRKKTNTYKLI